MIDTILLVAAAVCLLLAAIGVSVNRISLGWLGLFFWVLSSLI